MNGRCWVLEVVFTTKILHANQLNQNECAESNEGVCCSTLNADLDLVLAVGIWLPYVAILVPQCQAIFHVGSFRDWHSVDCDFSLAQLCELFGSRRLLVLSWLRPALTKVVLDVSSLALAPITLQSSAA